ncbi:MAG TPA: GNAT family N-acetyltransferase [Methylophilaceae bacterium]|nr:GNAT family N-acetyltransferase [Methylophilaceae bacterium]
MKQAFYIKQVAWSTHGAELRFIRESVFIKEQSVPVSLEWDGLDDDAKHLIAIDDENHTLGCARIVNQNNIGRMAVMQEKRGLGIGLSLLNAAVEHCRTQDQMLVKLSAQMHAVPFYEKSGFTITSAPYLDANIWHVDMQLYI